METPQKMKSKLVGKCRLCYEEKELISKSHILPKFFFKKILAEDDEEFVVMNADMSNLKNVRDHGYEGGLLCANCDNKILSRYEDYGSKFLFGSLSNKNMLKGKTLDSHHYIENVNYHKLKLFFLSLLWRSSISSSRTFTAVKLDEQIEEEIRMILLNNQFIPETKFPVTLWSYLHLKEIPSALILPPWIGNKNKGEQNFHIIGGGLFLQLTIEYDKLDPMNKEAMLSESGVVKIIHIPSESMKAMINTIIGWNWLT